MVLVVASGPGRKAAIKYGAVVRVCDNCCLDGRQQGNGFLAGLFYLVQPALATVVLDTSFLNRG
jgi:hypothetical protein